MDTEMRKAIKVKSMVERLMREKIYEGDLEKPRIKPDANGTYQFRDNKIQISCMPSPREGLLNCSVKVELVRRRFPTRKLETVMETGFGVDIYTFRTGLWIDYLTEMAESLNKTAEERKQQEKQQQEEGERRAVDDNFSPVDDAALFGPRK